MRELSFTRNRVLYDGGVFKEEDVPSVDSLIDVMGCFPLHVSWSSFRCKIKSYEQVG